MARRPWAPSSWVSWAGRDASNAWGAPKGFQKLFLIHPSGLIRKKHQMESSEGGKIPVLTLAFPAADLATFLPFAGTVVPRGLFSSLCRTAWCTAASKLTSRARGESLTSFCKALGIGQERKVQEFAAAFREACGDGAPELGA